MGRLFFNTKTKTHIALGCRSTGGNVEKLDKPGTQSWSLYFIRPYFYSQGNDNHCFLGSDASEDISEEDERGHRIMTRLLWLAFYHQALWPITSLLQDFLGSFSLHSDSQSEALTHSRLLLHVILHLERISLSPPASTTAHLPNTALVTRSLSFTIYFVQCERGLAGRVG